MTEEPPGSLSPETLELGPGDLGPPEELPRRIGPYEIVSELGRGAMGVVYRAMRPELDRAVALKLLKLERALRPEDLARFHAEGRTVAMLRHPNVVSLLDVGESSLGPYLVLELVDGETLYQKLGRAGPLDSQETARVTSKIARALAHAHELGIIHRDVKPGNVLLTATGEPLLSDFGLAKDLGRDERLTGSNLAMGTPVYMSPEQARCVPVDARTDVYSLGATIYETMTGKPPFERETALETLRAIVDDEPVPPSRRRPGIAPELETICLRCLEKDRANRYPSAHALALDLERFLGHEPITARRPGTLERARRALRRRPGLAVVTGLLVFLLALATTAAIRGNAARRRAGEDAALAREVLGLLVDDVRDGLDDEEGPRVRARRRDLLERAAAAVERLGALEDERGLLTLPAAESHREIAELALAAADTGRALREYERSGEILRRMEANPEAEQVLVSVLVELGHVKLLRGDLLGARTTLEEAIDRARRRTDKDHDPGARGALVQVLRGLAAVLGARRELGAARRALDEALETQHDLARTGDARARRQLAATLLAAVRVTREQGDLTVALALAREAVDVARSIVALAPANPALRRALASALVAVGSVRAELGEIKGDEHGEALALARELVARNPDDFQARADLAEALLRLGQAALARHEPARALEVLEEALAPARALCARDPENTYAARALATILEKTGEARNALGDLVGAMRALEEGLAIDERLGPAAQTDTARCLSRLAGVQDRSGDVRGAILSYGRSVSIERTLAASDPSNAVLRLELAVTLGRWGELLEDEHDAAGAKERYEEGLAMVSRLLERDPGNARARANRVAAHIRLALLLDRKGDEDGALGFVERAVSDQSLLDSGTPHDTQRLQWLTTGVRPEFTRTRDLLSGAVTPATRADHHQLGRALFRRGDPVKATASLRLALEGEPPPDDGWFFEAACAAAQALALTPKEDVPALGARALEWLKMDVRRAEKTLAEIEQRLATEKASPERDTLVDQRQALLRHLEDVRSRAPELAPLRAMPGFPAIRSTTLPQATEK
jgi:serine/threonine-protein kinase